MSDELETDIYNLELHQFGKIPGGFYVTRVPGGWIYQDITDDNGGGIFVPWNNEFQTD